ncbi:MAG: type VI secretion system protein TssA [Pirellulales bacterium]|nr:type VI secretion system protein TssA [Pirellulales bacterium]
MANHPIIDIDALLRPISDEFPTGVALDRSDAESPYHTVQAARDKAKNAERKYTDYFIVPPGDKDSIKPPDKPDWSSVIRLASETMQNVCKDFRIACWLTEALIQQYGFVGMRDGFLLCRRLCEEYWDNLHPLPTPEAGHEYSMGIFEGLVGDHTMFVLRGFPITTATDGSSYSMIDYDQVGELQKKSSEIREKRIKEGAITYEIFQQSIRNTPREFYIDLVDNLQQTIDNIQATGDFLEKRCQPNAAGERTAPSLARFRSSLIDFLDTIKRVAGNVLQEPESDNLAEGTDAEDVVGGDLGKNPLSQGRISGRQEALDTLHKLADFFEHSEPHSPISYALRQVARWGTMSLPELLSDLIQDDGVREELRRRTGVPNLKRQEDS